VWGLLTLTQKFPVYYWGDHIPSSDHLRQYHLNAAQIITEVPGLEMRLQFHI